MAKAKYTLHTARETVKAIGWTVEKCSDWFLDNPHPEQFVAFWLGNPGSSTRQYIFSNSLATLVKYATERETLLTSGEGCYTCQAL
jgi:hypothetical protein